MARDPNCIFFKIGSGQIPSAKVFETDSAVAFLDINPVAGCSIGVMGGFLFRCYSHSLVCRIGPLDGSSSWRMTCWNWSVSGRVKLGQ